MPTILADPALKDVAGWMLKTRDAHGLYQKLGFAPPSDPERFLRRAGNRPA